MKIKELELSFDRIRNHYLRILVKKFLDALMLILNGVWAIPFIIVVRIIKPYISIKIGECNTSRIGHFVIDALYFISDNQKNKRNEMILISPQGISNITWYKLIKKYMHMNKVFKYLYFWNKFVPGSKNHSFYFPKNNSRDLEGIFFRHLLKPKLDEKQNFIGIKSLRKLGWAGEPYICILSRDKSYLAVDKIHGGDSIYKVDDYAYHNYRNSDIQSFKKSIEFLLAQGFWVFRMGKETESELKIDHKNFLDYSRSKIRSDLMDIYLFSNCSGCISTSTGLDQIPLAYGIPTLVVNGLPLSGAGTCYNLIWVPKNLYWKNNRTPLKLNEYIEASYTKTQDYESAGIMIIDLHQDQIFEATREFMNRIKNRELIDEKDSSNQKYFLSELKKWDRFEQFHSFIHPNFKLGKNWLDNILVSKSL